MRFSQIFLKMGYNTVAKVNKVVENKVEKNGTSMDAEYLGTFKRYDRVPGEIWLARVCTFYAEAKDELLVVIEENDNEYEA